MATADMVRRAILPFLRFVDWLFGKRGGGIDLVLAIPAIGWTALMVLKPDLFDVGAFQGMAWLPDEAWIAITAVLSLGHLGGLFMTRLYRPRVCVCFAAAWVWISISISLGRYGWSPGVLMNAELGLMALFGGLYILGLPQRMSE